MSLQTLHLTRPALVTRLANPSTVLHPLTSAPRDLRRTERALIDGLQAWARAGRGLTALIAVDQPGPSLSFNLPAIQTNAPLLPSPYGVMSQVLTTISRQSDTRAAIRAEAHALSLSLPRSASAAESAPRLVETLTQLLQRTADQAPLIIQIDHLHRADGESIKLLRALTVALADTQLVIVGTYRADQPLLPDLGAWLTDAHVMQAACAPAWVDDLPVWLDDVFGRKTPLASMIEAAKNHERSMLLGGVPLLEACRRAGRWTDGLTLSERVITLAQVLGADYILAAARVIRSQILLGLGQWAEAQTECDLVITSSACATDRNLAAAALWGGYKARSMANLPARNLMDALRRWRIYARTTDDAASAAPLMADMVVHLVETDQMNDARAWQRDLEALLDHTRHPAARLAVALGQGMLTARTSDWRATIGAYRAVIQHATAQHDVLFEARGNGGLALALLELGDTESKNEGRERLSLAHSVLSRLNARPDMERCEAGAKQFGLRPRQRRAAATNRTPGSLTRREREVLALVVNGMTNRQIAQRLTISEKTAEGHVGNILAKLSCSSRTKAAELAKATGLLEGSAA